MSSRALWVLMGVLAAQAAKAQVPPAKPMIPNTPDVVAPPPLSLLDKGEIEVGSKPLGVHEAIAIAMKKQAQVLSAKGNLLSARGSTQQAAAGLQPQVSAFAGYNGQAAIVGNNVVAEPNLFSVGANLSLLLFDFGRTRDLVRQRSALEKASEQSLSSTYLSVALQVKLDFYSFVQGQADIALSEADVANRKRQLDEASARVTAGIGPPSDLAQAKTNLADGLISLVSARDSALQAQIALATDMGIDPLTPLTPDTSAEALLPAEQDLRGLVKTALSARPDVSAARGQAAAAAFGVSFASKGNVPTVTLTTGVSGQDPTAPLSNQTGVAAVTVQWFFADGGSTAGQIKQARGSQSVADANLIQVTQQAVAAVGSAYVDLNSARQRTTLATVEVANAKELLRISEGRYDGGEGLFLDITTAQNSLVAAQRNLAQAQADEQRARARLRNAVGLVE
jgi:outer membrane protein